MLVEYFAGLYLACGESSTSLDDLHGLQLRSNHLGEKLCEATFRERDGPDTFGRPTVPRAQPSSSMPDCLPLITTPHKPLDQCAVFVREHGSHPQSVPRAVCLGSTKARTATDPSWPGATSMMAGGESMNLLTSPTRPYPRRKRRDTL